MDVLTDILSSSGLVTHLLAQQAFYRPFAVTFPCPRSMGFHVLTQGEAYIRSPRLAQPIHLRRGDFVLLPRGFQHEIATDPATPASARERIDWQWCGVPQEGDAAPLATLICGVYQFQTDPIHPLFRHLPDQILLRAEDVPPHDPIHAALALLSAELARPGPGTSMVTRGLVDILFNYILRTWIDLPGSRDQPWPQVLRERKLAEALSAIHGDPRRSWSVADLAERSGMSRTSFAQQFRTLIGDTPIHYLTRVRIQKAMDMLRATARPVEQIAEAVGFADAFVFSKAFKRVNGVSPRQFRTQMQALAQN